MCQSRKLIIYIVVVVTITIVNKRLELSSHVEILVSCIHQITDLSSTPAVRLCDQLSIRTLCSFVFLQTGASYNIAPDVRQ